MNFNAIANNTAFMHPIKNAAASLQGGSLMEIDLYNVPPEYSGMDAYEVIALRMFAEYIDAFYSHGMSANPGMIPSVVDYLINVMDERTTVSLDPLRRDTILTYVAECFEQARMGIAHVMSHVMRDLEDCGECIMDIGILPLRDGRTSVITVAGTPE